MSMHPVRRLPPSLPAPLARALARFRRLELTWSVLGRVGLALLVTGSVIALACAMDRLVDVPGVIRWPLPYLAGMVAIVSGGAALWLLLRRPDYDNLAHRLDVASDDRRGGLRSVLDFVQKPGGGGPFAALSRERALAHWASKDTGAYVEKKRAARLLAGSVALAALLGVATQVEAVRAGLLWRRFVDPLGNHPRPTATWFEIGAPHRLNGGDAFVLTATMRGRNVNDPKPMARLTQAGSAPVLRPLEKLPDGRWRLRVEKASTDFSVRVVMGPARTEAHEVRVIPRPAVETIRVRYVYPRYSGKEPRTETLEGRTLTALEGTKARIELTANIPLRKVRGEVEEEARGFRIDGDDPRLATRHHFMNRNETMALRLEAENGLTSLHELPINIRVVPDAPPTVTGEADWGTRAFFLHDTVVLGFSAQDDIGLAEVSVQAENVDFLQEADLDAYGARAAKGRLSIPVAQLARPGVEAVRLRLVARDLKGQATRSQPLTLRIAVNSYDRKLRTARNALKGDYNTRDPETAGFPSLKEHTEVRPTALKTLRGKLTMLAAMLGKDGKPGKVHEKTIDEIRGLTQSLAPRVWYLRPSIGLRPDGVTTSFDVLAQAKLTPRLHRLVADAIFGSELSQNGNVLAARFEQALKSKSPSEALKALQQQVTASLERQEEVAAHLGNYEKMIRVELAGYLAARLARDLEEANPDTWRDRDFLLHAHADLREASALLEALQADAVSMTILAKAAKGDDQAEALRAARPALEAVLPPLRTLAEALALNDASLPWRGYGTADGFADEDWLDVARQHLVMRLDDDGADELALLSEAFWLAAPDSDNPPAYSTPVFRQYAAVSRFVLRAEELSRHLLTGRWRSDQPEALAAWIDLRDLRFALIRETRAHPPAEAERTLANLLDLSAPLADWMPPKDATETLGQRLTTWSRLAGMLADKLRPEAAAAIRKAADASGSACKERLRAGLAAYGQAIRARQNEIESVPDVTKKYAVQNAIYRPLPMMYARARTLKALAVRCMDVLQASAFHEEKTAFPAEALTPAAVLLDQVATDLFENVGRPMSNVIVGGKRDDAAMAEAAQAGKVKCYNELGALVAETAELLKNNVSATAVDAALDRRVLLHRAAAERKALQASRSLLAPLTEEGVRDLKADRLRSPALWADVAARLALCGMETKADRRKAMAEALRARVEKLGNLPAEAKTLPDLLRTMSEAPSATTWRAEAEAMLADLRPLAATPVDPGGNEAMIRWRLLVAAERLDRYLSAAGQGGRGLSWALSEREWARHKQATDTAQVGIGGLAVGGEDDLTNLKLPRHLYEELRRAREQGMPVLFKEHCYRYLNRILEKAR